MTGRCLENRPLAERKAFASKLLKAHGDRVPVLLSALFPAPPPEKPQVLAPAEFTYAAFLHSIRRYFAADASVALFFSTRAGLLPGAGELMSAVYARHKEADDFLHVCCSAENCFGQS